MRYVSAPVPVTPLRIRPPLRILGLIADPSDLPALDIADEKRRLSGALAGLGGKVELHWASGGRWADLQEALLAGPWHVLHFVGHGGFRDEQGTLALVGADGRADLVSARRFRALLSTAVPPPRLVLLNSCSSGQASAHDTFTSTATALVRQIPAVVAMQFVVSDLAARAFASGFYSALAGNRSVGDAVRNGRISVYGISEQALEWVTPVLYLRGEDMRLFELTQPVTEGVDGLASPAVVRAKTRVGRAALLVAVPVLAAVGGLLFAVLRSSGPESSASTVRSWNTPSLPLTAGQSIDVDARANQEAPDLRWNAADHQLEPIGARGLRLLCRFDPGDRQPRLINDAPAAIAYMSRRGSRSRTTISVRRPSPCRATIPPTGRTAASSRERERSE